jgi:hypothetical protein
MAMTMKGTVQFFKKREASRGWWKPGTAEKLEDHPRVLDRNLSQAVGSCVLFTLRIFKRIV